MSRIYNFSAGPAVLPESVLREAQEEMMDYRGCGMSVFDDSDESDEKPCGRLYCDWTVGEEGMAGGTEIWPGECDCIQRGQNVLLDSGLQRSSGQRECRLCIYL